MATQTREMEQRALSRARTDRPRWRRAGGDRSLISYVVLAAYTAIILVPIVIVLSASVHPAGLPRLFPDQVTFEHYQRILSDPKFLRALINSFIVTGGSVILSVTISALAGYAFSRYDFRGKAILMAVTLGIFMIPVSVNIIPLYVMIQRVGWLNTYQGLIIPYQALILPLNVWLLKNFFDTIPRDLEEAALVDGANRWAAFWRVTLPLAWPGLAVASIFAFRFSWNDFVFAATFNSTAGMRTWQAAMYTFLGLERTDWGPLTAGVVIGMLPVVILFTIFQRRFIQGLTVGAVK
ncbi:MAG TPA: carbohydrate ABC transporter permease [Promineifilum sp.]